MGVPKHHRNTIGLMGVPKLHTLEFVRMHGPDVDTTIAQIRVHHAKQTPA